MAAGTQLLIGMTPLSRANAFSFLVPIFGLSLAIAFYGEALTVSVAVGALLAFLGILPPSASK